MARNNHNDVWEAIRETQKEIGKLVNAQGYLVEGLIAPAIPNIFRKFGIAEIHRNSKGSINGSNMEVDVIGPCKDKVVVCEIKSKLKKEDVDELLEKLPKFTKFFPDYKGRNIIGLVAGVNIDDGIDKYAERKGLYVLAPSGDTMRIANTKTFKPKYF